MLGGVTMTGYRKVFLEHHGFGRLTIDGLHAFLFAEITLLYSETYFQQPNYHKTSSMKL